MSRLSKVSTLVSTAWLREKACILSTPKGAEKLGSSLRILDTSWMPEPHIDGYSKFYKEAHIPNAGYFDLKKITPKNTSSSVKFPIPDSNVFQDYVEELGVSNHTHVIAYDRFNTRPSFRAWFLFRLFGHDNVSVLSGGLLKWVSEGLHVTTEEPIFEPGTFEVNFRPHLLRNFDEMLKTVKSREAQIMDARGAASFYNLKEDEPDGHLPGSKNIPFASLYNEDGTVKSKKDLQELFTAAGIDLTQPLVSSCQSGMTACGLIAAAHILGNDNIPLYNGSFHEWNSLADESLIVRKQGK